MMPPLDLSPGALGFIMKTAPVLPAEVVQALGLRVGTELYASGREAGGQGPHVDPGPNGSSPGGEQVRDMVREFADSAVGHLDEVLGRPEGGRELAFRLLAADALLTWACEAAARAPRPDHMLRDVVTALTASTP